MHATVRLSQQTASARLSVAGSGTGTVGCSRPEMPKRSCFCTAPEQVPNGAGGRVAVRDAVVAAAGAAAAARAAGEETVRSGVELGWGAAGTAETDLSSRWTFPTAPSAHSSTLCREESLCGVPGGVVQCTGSCSVCEGHEYCGQRLH